MRGASWTTVGSYGTKLEADMARATLESAGIEVLIHGEQTGLFGAGFQGWAPGLTTVAVPANRATEARELLVTDAV